MSYKWHRNQVQLVGDTETNLLEPVVISLVVPFEQNQESRFLYSRFKTVVGNLHLDLQHGEHKNGRPWLTAIVDMCDAQYLSMKFPLQRIISLTEYNRIHRQHTKDMKNRHFLYPIEDLTDGTFSYAALQRA